MQTVTHNVYQQNVLETKELSQQKCVTSYRILYYKPFNHVERKNFG